MTAKKKIDNKNTKKNEVKKVSKKKVTKEQIQNNDNYFSVTEVIVLIIITVIVSLVIGSLVTYNLNKGKYNTNDKHLKEFIKNYNYVLDNYYENVDKNKLINGAIRGMVDTLDDSYSYSIDEEDTDSFNIRLAGEYKGIGVEIVSFQDDNRIIVYSVFEGSPADKAGLKTGDIIKKVDDKDCSDMTTSELSKYIRNNSKSKFNFVIERDGEEKELTLIKDSVTIKSVESEIYERNGKKIGYIRISLFSNVAVTQFIKELKVLENKDIDSLIIDVRDNSGGHLTTATRIISLFLDSDHVIYQTNTKGKIKKYHSTGTKTKKYPIVVLQNHESASASEMLSAALKEEYGATVVGDYSYGKGTVQELNSLNDRTEYKITTKLWLTPKGNSINKKGIEPDVKVQLNEEYTKDPSEENDNQLQEAIDILADK